MVLKRQTTICLLVKVRRVVVLDETRLRHAVLTCNFVICFKVKACFLPSFKIFLKVARFI